MYDGIFVCERSPAKLSRQLGVKNWWAFKHHCSSVCYAPAGWSSAGAPLSEVISASTQWVESSRRRVFSPSALLKQTLQKRPTSSWPGSGWRTAHRGWSAPPPRSPACWSLAPRCSPSSRGWRSLWSAQSDNKRLQEAWRHSVWTFSILVSSVFKTSVMRH